MLPLHFGNNWWQFRSLPWASSYRRCFGLSVSTGIFGNLEGNNGYFEMTTSDGRWKWLRARALVLALGVLPWIGPSYHNEMLLICEQKTHVKIARSNSTGMLPGSSSSRLWPVSHSVLKIHSMPGVPCLFEINTIKRWSVDFIPRFFTQNESIIHRFGFGAKPLRNKSNYEHL